MSKITRRITTLERWGMRTHADFQAEGVNCIKDAGFTGLLVNGGSGIGPDMMPAESLVESTVLPDLMPFTVQGNRHEMKRRCALLQEAGIVPWLCLWGVPGPDESAGAQPTESNRLYDRRTKIEMKAKLLRTPEIFGHRKPEAQSWRGSRPLCVSHPKVQEYYRDLMKGLVTEYSDLEGIFYFPGDANAEICDESCERCKTSGLDDWGRTIRYVNELYTALTEVKPGFNFYFAIWDQHKPGGDVVIQRFLDDLHPGIGICMSITDNYVDQRKSGPMNFNQPWMNWVKPGESFMQAATRAHEQGRPNMVMGEISQSEVWDPVCHNMPHPYKVLDFLRATEAVPGADAIMDFWGNRGPFDSHTNHALMRCFYENPSAEPETLLRKAAAEHYEIDDPLIEQVLACWKYFDEVVDDWALVMWPQRFSYSIGRDAARGYLYRPLIPPVLKGNQVNWACTEFASTGVDPDKFCDFNESDCVAFANAAQKFDDLVAVFEEGGNSYAARIARGEARNIQLAGEIIASQGRYIAANHAFNTNNHQRLRTLIEAEIAGRIRQQEITAQAGWGSGINPLLVDEDIQNMRLYLSCDDFPNTADDLFHLTAVPYSI